MSDHVYHSLDCKSQRGGTAIDCDCLLPLWIPRECYNQLQSDLTAAQARIAELERDVEDLASASDHHNKALTERATKAEGEAARMREALTTIRDAFWTDGESGDERVQDLQEIARAALTESVVSKAPDAKREAVIEAAQTRVIYDEQCSPTCNMVLYPEPGQHCCCGRQALSKAVAALGDNT